MRVLDFDDGGKVVGSDELEVRSPNAWLRRCLPTFLYCRWT